MLRMNVKEEIKIRECKKLDELADCVRLQREVFNLPNIELSPVRHFVVTFHAGGFTLGAYHQNKLVGFTLSVPAISRGEKAFYSHMTAVDKNFQGYGIGGKLKWKQREKSLELGVETIKWTFQPILARNAYFNLEKLGAEIHQYKPNFYGTDYATSHTQNKKIGIDSDRLFAEWKLKSDKVSALANKEVYLEKSELLKEVTITNDWNTLLTNTPHKALEEQTRVKNEFRDAFEEGLICKGFDRTNESPKYLFYKN